MTVCGTMRRLLRIPAMTFALTVNTAATELPA